MGKINRLNNTIMKKIFFITLLIVIGKSIANAQIKVVDDDYRSSLTAAKSYYEQDVEFEKIFPKAYLGSGFNVVDMGGELFRDIQFNKDDNSYKLELSRGYIVELFEYGLSPIWPW